MGEAPKVVEGLEVKNYRGLRRASLSKFAGINVLVGRSGSGKSSVLEALYIALRLHEGLGYAIKRRGWFGPASVEAVFHDKSEETRISVSLGNGSYEDVVIGHFALGLRQVDMVKARGLDISRLHAIAMAASGEVSVEAAILIDHRGRYFTLPTDIGVTARGTKAVRNAVFADRATANTYGAPEELYSTMVAEGGGEARESVVRALQAVYGGLHDIAVLHTHGEWVLHLVFKDRAVPYYVEGDGIRHALVSLMAASTYRGAVVLMEEPELAAHPGLIEVVAGSIIRSYRERGNQVFISTHSPELVEMLLEQAEKSGLGDQDLKVYRVTLEGGTLHSEEHTMSEALNAVRIGWDLRK